MHEDALVDVAIEAGRGHTCADLTAALTACLGTPITSLWDDRGEIPPDTPVGIPPLVHWAIVYTAPQRRLPTAGAGATLDLCVVAGPDCGMRMPLGRVPISVGRARGAGLRINDPALSRHHAEVRLDGGTVRLVDLDSTNASLIDGLRVPVEGGTFSAASTLQLGATYLDLRPRATARSSPEPDHEGRLVLRPVARQRPTMQPVDVQRPPRPAREPAARVPWLAGVLPLPVAGLLALLWGPQVLAFAVLGPLILLGTAAQDRWSSRRRYAEALRRHNEAESKALHHAHELAEHELRVRHQRTPDPVTVLDRARGPALDLWSATARDPDAGVVRLRVGPLESHVRISSGTKSACLVHERAPHTANLAESCGLAISGDAAPALRWVVGQLLASLPPSELAVALVGSPSPEWAWLSRVPHALDDVADMACLTDIAAACPAPRLLLIAPAANAQLRAQLDGIRGERVWVLAGVSEQTADPAIEPATGLDGVGLWWAERLSRALAPLRPPGGGRQLSTLSVRQLSGVQTFTELASRWSATSTALSTPVGATAEAALTLDLVRDGPHVLVGGTTGSGKSEFLRSLVCGLALRHSPDAVDFVLIDYKGGATFEPLMGLPHVVGMVTDLDEHGASRALISLRAELSHRERVLAGAGAQDLATYQRLHLEGHPAAVSPLPRLVIVVDEFRVLSEELPEFVAGVVRLAAVGRSLGIHLVLATQRPSGVITPDIQANVSARIAFRVRDAADSRDILDSPQAATIPPTSPGSALIRLAGGELTAFRGARVIAPRDEPKHLTVSVASNSAAAEPATGDGEIDAITQLAAAAMDHLDLASPRRPWLPPLPTSVSCPAPEKGVDPTWAIADDPARQQQSALTWGPMTSVLIIGPARSGRSSAALAIASGAMAARSPNDLVVYAVGSGPSVDAIAGLPHCGGAIGPDDERGMRAVTERLGRLVDRATSGLGPKALLVIDGWDGLLGGRTSAAWSRAVEPLLHVLRRGRSHGLEMIITGDASLSHGPLRSLTDATLALRLANRVEAVSLGVPGALTTADTPGRGVLLPLGLEVQVVRAEPYAACARTRWSGQGTEIARIRALPDYVPASDLPTSVPGVIHLGRGGEDGRCVDWDLSTLGHVVLIAGPPHSGRSTIAATIAATLAAPGGGAGVAAAAPCVILADRLSPAFGVVPRAIHLRPDDPESVTALIEYKREHPNLTVVIDGADRIDGQACEPVVRELIDVADRDHSLVLVTTISASLSGRFRGLDVELPRLRPAAILLWPTADRGAAEVLRAREIHGIPSLPGRGVLITPGQTIEIQLAASTARSDGVVAAAQSPITALNPTATPISGLPEVNAV